METITASMEMMLVAAGVLSVGIAAVWSVCAVRRYARQVRVKRNTELILRRIAR